MHDEDAVIERAKVLFDAGAEVVYLAAADDGIGVTIQPPDRPGVIVAARSVYEVQRFVRDTKLWIAKR